MTAEQWKEIKAEGARHHITAGALRLWMHEQGLTFNDPKIVPAKYVSALRLRAEGQEAEANAAIEEARGGGTELEVTSFDH